MPSELIKLETMFYHARQKKHLRFLAANELYANLRTINSFKAGKEIGEGQTLVHKPE